MAPATRTITSTSNNEDVAVNERLRSVEESLAQVTRALQDITTMNLGMTGNDRNQNQQQFTRMTKVEFPKFSGDDVKGWIFRCEQLFSIDEIPENQKVKLISVHLFDTALLWHRQFIRLNGENVSSNVYKSGILQRHKCAGKLFSLLLIPDDEDCFEDCVDELEENRNSMGIQDLQPQISLNALTGTNNFQTMRVIGTVGKHLVHILVDCGSTHNFLDKNMAKKLGCSIRPTGPLAVTVADGNNLVTTSECRNFKWQFGNTTFTTDVMLLPFEGCEMVLGIQWLATLGDIKCNFKELRMEVKYEGKKVQLRGTHKSNLVWLSDKKSKKNARQVVQGEFHSMALSVYPMNTISCSNLEGMSMEVDEQIKAILKNYKDVFGIPVELLPHRQLNKQTIKYKFPIPIIEELIDELHGAKYFTKLDLRSSYHQIRMNEADVAKTAFRTHEGHYEFLVMPFGLTNAPSTFQSLMNEVFKPYLRKFTLVFFDDILIYSQRLEEHIRHLQIILETMRTHKLFAKLSKCVFGTIQVEYLGHVIYAQGVATDPAKIEAMANCPVLVSLKQLRGFLGLTGYYRRFIKGFTMISRSLTQLLKKEAYGWNSAAQSAFEYLKQAMISASVLKLLDFTKEFTIKTDA
ncbi:gypsy/ty3 retroelement polyprotein [Tanacetum coccineum]